MEDFNIEIATDIFGNYFVTKIYEEQNKNEPSLKDLIKDEIEMMGFKEYFHFGNNIEILSNSKYKCKLIFENEYDYFEGLINAIPTIVKIKEIKGE